MARQTRRAGLAVDKGGRVKTDKGGRPVTVPAETSSSSTSSSSSSSSEEESP